MIYYYFLHYSTNDILFYHIHYSLQVRRQVIYRRFGFFDNLIDLFKAGLIIPITGFAHSTTASAMEYRKEGLTTGIGANIFKLSGSVILYGIVSAYLFGIIRYLLFGA